MEVINCEDDGPFAKHSRLGLLCVVEPLGAKSWRNIKNNHTRITVPVKDVLSGAIADHCFTPTKSVRESPEATMLNNMYQIEFNEKQGEKIALSQEDEMFLEIMKNEAVRVDGKHKLPLPLG